MCNMRCSVKRICLSVKWVVAKEAASRSRGGGAPRGNASGGLTRLCTGTAVRRAVRCATHIRVCARGRAGGRSSPLASREGRSEVVRGRASSRAEQPRGEPRAGPDSLQGDRRGSAAAAARGASVEVCLLQLYFSILQMRVSEGLIIVLSRDFLSEEQEVVRPT